MRRRAFPRAAAVGVFVGAALALISPGSGPASAAGPRPLFQLPFACGERWSASTRSDHIPNPNSLDMFRVGGNTNNQPIIASFGGQVANAGWDDGGGWFVRINHGGGWQTRYLHMIAPPAVSIGQQVAQGQRLGNVGSTGNSGAPHLHFEQMQDGTTVRSAFNGVLVTVEIGSSQILTSNNCGGGPGPLVENSRFADIDGDGRADLIGISGANNDLTAYRNQGWSAAALIVGSDRASLVSGFGDASRTTFADIDGDGLADLIGVSGANNDLTAYRNQGWNAPGGTFVGWDRKHVVSGFGPLTAVKFADMDGDGRADLIGFSGANSDMTAYRNQGWNAAALIVGSDRKAIASGFGGPANVKFADMDGDGRAELIGLSGAANDITAYRNQGWAAPSLIVGSDRKHVVSGFGPLVPLKLVDVDGDGRADLIGISGANSDMTAYRNQGWAAPELIAGWDRKHVVSGFPP
jgi:hypothetical protein